MFRILVAVLLLASPPLAQAEAPNETLSRCLADNTTGKDRKDLARWIFFAMAAHPEIKQYADSSALLATEQAHKVVAATFTRLVTESCAQETRTAFSQGGTMAIQVAFETLGALAMQELMSDPDVKATMSAFERHIDQDRLNHVLASN